MLRRSILLVVMAAALAFVAGAGATAGPVGPLPPGPVTTISTIGSSFVSVVLPKAAQGRVWRQARQYNGKVLRQVSEANVGANVVIVFQAVGHGSTTVVYGLTRGETPKAYASATFKITVR